MSCHASPGSPGRPTRVAALTLLLGTLFLGAEAASIVVAPTAVYIDHQTRSAEVVLFNPSDVAEEVTVEAVFGYPATRDDGSLYLELEEDSTNPRSAASWIRPFPRRMIIQPGARQVVRLLGEPPADLPDGEYWTRLVFTARGQSLPVSASAGSPPVRVGLDLEVRTIIAATYRKGTVDTGLEVSDLDPRVEADTLHLRPLLVRRGSAAWIGAFHLRLLLANGAEVRGWQEQVAVYDRYHRAFAYPLEGLPAGTYTLEARLTTRRDDVPAGFRLAAPDWTQSVSVRVP
ncbi:MAG: hypothetical protein EA350_14960 [Gemmatimonadales bacterium]|nr:MAG: hypothetical protein EA350_14960 [Gemmatimonadales bacterium]